MKVLNVHDFTGDWPPNTVNIMRPGLWGNPFAGPSRTKNIADFEAWLRKQPALVARAKRELQDHDLVCCCAPKPCHGDIWVKIIKGDIK